MFLHKLRYAIVTQAIIRASDISRGRGPAKFRYFREIPRNSPKNAKYREIRQKYFQIHIGKTYLILILAIRPQTFYSPQTSKFSLKLRHCNEQTTSQNYQAFLDERCEKLGTNHNVNSSFLERTVVERANDYPC